MALSNNLISQFVKSTKDTIPQKKETYVYGEIKHIGDSDFVKLDGSDALIPADNATVNVKDGDRVSVLIKNNTAVVTGNFSDPALMTTELGKAVINYIRLTPEDGLVLGDFTGEELLGNIQMKAEIGGSSISLRHGNTILTKFMATNKAFTGITDATTQTANGTDSMDDEDGTTTTENIVSASQTVKVDQTLSVVQFESANPIYFTQGIRTAGVTINDNSMISNVDFTLNGRLFDKNGRSAFEPITSEGNLSIGYGRYKNATANSKDWSTLYGNKVRLTTKNGAFIYQNGSAALETLNSHGNATFGYHLKKKGSGSTNIYAGDGVNLIGKSTYIQDSTGNAAFESRNNDGNTTLGYARYANSGNTNIYGGTQLNLITKSGGTIRAHNALAPSSNASLALGVAGELGWSNIYIGNASGAYNGLRIIVGGENLNLCGRDEDGLTIFGNASAVMHYRAKDVNTTDRGNAFRITSGNDSASNNTESIWLFGAADSTSRYIGSYLTYNRTYASAANMHVTANGVFGRSTSSSERYKTDIRTTSIDEFKGLYNLPVKKFKYKDGYICPEDEYCGCDVYGFVVEDMEDVFPTAVQHITDENGEKLPEMWNSNIIVPSLLKLIQDLNNRVKTLEENSITVEYDA